MWIKSESYDIWIKPIYKSNLYYDFIESDYVSSRRAAVKILNNGEWTGQIISVDIGPFSSIENLCEKIHLGEVKILLSKTNADIESWNGQAHYLTR